MVLVKEFIKDSLKIKIYDSRKSMGQEAARDVAVLIEHLLLEKQEINMVFAAAPSQDEFLAAMVSDRQIEWNRINAFHMDEYIGIDQDAPQAFGNYLRNRLFGKVGFKTVHYLNSCTDDSDAECRRYSDLLKQFPTDIVCMGVGENGHIAFNDPHAARFYESNTVKVVELDGLCRMQQVNDKCFSNLELVPKFALTLTIPALLSGKYIFCMVPGGTKAKAMENMIKRPVNESCPASILRTHKSSVLYLDTISASLIY